MKISVRHLFIALAFILLFSNCTDTTSKTTSHICGHLVQSVIGKQYEAHGRVNTKYRWDFWCQLADSNNCLKFMYEVVEDSGSSVYGTEDTINTYCVDQRLMRCSGDTLSFVFAPRDTTTVMLYNKTDSTITMQTSGIKFCHSMPNEFVLREVRK
ncbi:MAG: hypothetical protein RL660_3050 [Bacteroidota bacterium]|jgi:hypothetical protein